MANRFEHRTREKPGDPFAEPARMAAIREGLRAVCAGFPDACWCDLDAWRDYPAAFVRAMTDGGWIGALIPTEYGGLGLGFAEAATILEEVNRGRGNAGPAHAQMYVMGTRMPTPQPASGRRG